MLVKYYDIDLKHLLKVTMFGKTVLCSPEHHLTRTVRGTIIYIVADGSITLQQNDEIVKLEKGDMYVFEDGEHQTPLACENCTYYYVHFEKDPLSGVELSDEEFRERVFAYRKNFANSDIHTDTPYESIHAVIPKRLNISDASALERLTFPLKLHKLTYAYNTPELRLELSAIVSKLLMDAEDIALKEQNNLHTGKVGNVYWTAKNILSYVEKHYFENFGADEIVNEFHLNYDYANRIFKKHFGQSIINHRNRLRINTAKVLMLEKSINEVAVSLGFSNQYYFSKCFKKYEGISPLEYKEKVMYKNDK
jgi:AraC-like DNA-binding protein